VRWTTRTGYASLAEALAASDSAELREMVRGLVEEIRLVPDEGRLRVELRGELAAIVGLASGANAKRPGDEAEAPSAN